jgi:hypothetical protein
VEKVKLLLNGSHLAPQGESHHVITGMTTWSSWNTAPRETQSPPICRVKCRSDFATLSPVLLQKQPAVILLLGRTLASWSLAIDERGGHEDLCGLGRWNVIPYVHGRTGLYCSSLSYRCEPEPFLFSDP